jgi:hypothetical protein
MCEVSSVANEQNLTPFQPGNPGGGRPKGSLNMSTLVKKLLDDPELADKVITKKPSWWDNLPNKNLGEAVAIAMAIAAINGESRAANWIRKTGWGDKLNVEGDIRHEGVIIYKPEKYPRLTLPNNAVITAPPSIAPAAEQHATPPPAPNPDFDGIA